MSTVADIRARHDPACSGPCDVATLLAAIDQAVEVIKELTAVITIPPARPINFSEIAAVVPRNARCCPKCGLLAEHHVVSVCGS